VSEGEDFGVHDTITFAASSLTAAAIPRHGHACRLRRRQRHARWNAGDQRQRLTIDGMARRGHGDIGAVEVMPDAIIANGFDGASGLQTPRR
jgi:hypothetical protein